MTNATEQLARRVRAALGDYNNDELPVTQCVINLRKEVVSLQAAMIEAKSYIAHYMYGGTGREPAAKAIEIILTALQEVNHDNK